MTTTAQPISNKMQPLVAIKAMARLVRNPEATEEVFVIIRALAGDAVYRGYKKFCNTTHAKTILANTPLLERLADREHLRTLPAGSLGRAYLEFMEQGQITAEGLKAASEAEAGAEQGFADPGLNTYALRLRDQHDLWHVVTGFGRDVAGEACLLAFTYAQTKNRGIGFIAVIGALKLSKAYGRHIFASMWQGYQMGKRAKWLPAEYWEQLLTLPLEQVRSDLHLTKPDQYDRLPSALIMG